MKLIDKEKVVEEIEKRMQELHPTDTHKMQTGERVDRDVLMWLNALTWVKGIIDSIETKDVNMEKDVIGEYDCDDDSSWISFDGWMLNYSFVGKKVKVIIVDESMRVSE